MASGAKTLIVNAHWDAEARAWWADSDDIPGLVTEAATFEALVERALAIIPDLLELNGLRPDDGDIPVSVMAERTEKVRLRV